MEESASNLINFYTNRIEELKFQLDKSNNKIEKIREQVSDKYVELEGDLDIAKDKLNRQFIIGQMTAYSKVIKSIDEENNI